MTDDKKTHLHGGSKTTKNTKKPWQPMKLTLAGDAKDVIRHGVNKTSPGTGDPGEMLKNPQQG